VLSKLALYHLSYNSSPFCSELFWRWSLSNFLPGLASNINPSDFSLPSSQDYRRETLVPNEIERLQPEKWKIDAEQKN
jgi:hypothetical protein